MMGRSTGISMNFPYLRGTTVVSCRFTQVTGGELLDALDALGSPCHRCSPDKSLADSIG